jgi:transposase
VATQGQAVTGDHVEIASVDSGYTGPDPAASAAAHAIELIVVKTPEAKRGFVLLPTRWVVERSLAWTAPYRRLARDCERLPAVLAGLHFLVFACLMLHQVIHMYSSS